MMVTGHNRNQLWIFARTPGLETATLEQLQQQARDLGYDVAALRIMNHMPALPAQLPPLPGVLPALPAHPPTAPLQRNTAPPPTTESAPGPSGFIELMPTEVPAMPADGLPPPMPKDGPPPMPKNGPPPMPVNGPPPMPGAILPEPLQGPDTPEAAEPEAPVN